MIIQKFNTEALTRKALVLDAERYAAELAGRFPVSALKCAVVWLTDREAFVRVSGEPVPEGAEPVGAVEPEAAEAPETVEAPAEVGDAEA